MISNTELSWLGYAHQEIVGKLKFKDILSQKSSQIFEESILRFKESGKSENIEFELDRKDGTRFTVIMNANAAKSSSGTLAKRCSTIFELNDRKKA